MTLIQFILERVQGDLNNLMDCVYGVMESLDSFSLQKHQKQNKLWMEYLKNIIFVF